MNEQTKKQLITRLAENLPLLRKKIGLTQEELANKIGVTRITINSIERNKTMTWGKFTSIMIVLACNKEMCRLLKELDIYHNEINSFFTGTKRQSEIQEMVLSETKFEYAKEFAEYLPCIFIVFRATEEQELLFFNRRLIDLCGYSSKADLLRGTKSSFKNLIHSDDAKGLIRESRTLKNISKTSDFVEENADSEDKNVTHRILTKQGDIKWLNSVIKFTYLEGIGPVHLVFSYDITDQLARRVSADMLRKETSILNNGYDEFENPKASHLLKRRLNGVSVLLADSNETTLQAAEHLLTLEGAKVVSVTSGKKALSAVKKKNFNLVIIDVVMARLDGIEAIKLINEYYSNKGVNCPIIATTIVDTDFKIKDAIKAGAFDCIYKPLNIPELSSIVLAYTRKIETTMKSELADAVKNANTDSLTKVKSANAYSKDFAMHNTMLKKNKDNYPIGIAICDCDHLKGVNDTFGHSVGDIYIKNCCNLICDTFSHSPIYRIGGDEFLIFIQERDLRNCDALLETLNDKVEHARHRSSIHNGIASISVGVAKFDRLKDFDLTDTLRRADAEMYKVKRANHDRVKELLFSSKIN